MGWEVSRESLGTLGSRSPSASLAFAYVRKSRPDWSLEGGRGEDITEPLSHHLPPGGWVRLGFHELPHLRPSFAALFLQFPLASPALSVAGAKFPPRRVCPFWPLPKTCGCFESLPYLPFALGWSAEEGLSQRR